MTRRSSARLAGIAFIVYIVVGITGSVLYARGTAGATMTEKLASVPGHLLEIRLSLLLTILSAICALVLAVTLYGVTRDEDHELAMFGLVCRAGEGILGIFTVTTLGILWLGTASGPGAPDAAIAPALGTLFAKFGAWKATTCAFLFALGSTAFAWLLMRGRMIPRGLALLGVFASADLVIMLPLQLAGLVSGMIAYAVMWLPMLIFELVLAVLLIWRGVPVRSPAISVAAQ
jgi:hypothetical protein